jgi:hypothetical protein
MVVPLLSDEHSGSNNTQPHANYTSHMSFCFTLSFTLPHSVLFYLSLSNRQLEIVDCQVFVGGSTPSISCDDFDPKSSTCDVEVQFTYLISNTESIIPSSMPSAEPSAEPSISASPTTSKKSGKGSKTDSKKSTRNDGKGNGKGKVVTIGPSPAPKMGVVPEKLIELLGNRFFDRRRLDRVDPSCPESVSIIDIPAGTILAPGESINVTGSLIETDFCECFGEGFSDFSAGITGNPTSTTFTTPLGSGKGKGKTSVEEEDEEVDDAFACSAVAFYDRFS